MTDPNQELATLSARFSQVWRAAVPAIQELLVSTATPPKTDLEDVGIAYFAAWQKELAQAQRGSGRRGGMRGEAGGREGGTGPHPPVPLPPWKTTTGEGGALTGAMMMQALAGARGAEGYNRRGASRSTTRGSAKIHVNYI